MGDGKEISASRSGARSCAAKKKKKDRERIGVLERMRSDRHFFRPSWDIRHFGQVPRRDETTSSDSRVITSDIDRKAAWTRSDGYRNLAQWAPRSALH